MRFTSVIQPLLTRKQAILILPILIRLPMYTPEMLVSPSHQHGHFSVKISKVILSARPTTKCASSEDQKSGITVCELAAAALRVYIWNQ
jgi:hypothetical protein